MTQQEFLELPNGAFIEVDHNLYYLTGPHGLLALHDNKGGSHSIIVYGTNSKYVHGYTYMLGQRITVKAKLSDMKATGEIVDHYKPRSTPQK